jgi:hypothetical protein
VTLTVLLRALVGIACGAVLGTVVFLTMIQGSLHKGFTDFDFNHVLGTLIQGTATEKSGGGALSIVGDSVGPTGLYATLLGAVGLMLVDALALVPLVRRGWVPRGLVLGGVAALVVGLGVCGVADARLDTPTGLFGIDAGALTPVVIVLSSLAFGLVGARCYDLAMRPSWWMERRKDEAAVIESVAELEPAGESLELAEQGPEHGRVGA